MKKKFLNSSMKLIAENGTYSEEQIEIMTYGLETLYLLITKMIVIFALAFLFGIVKETLMLLITYNIIRSQAFGIHASKSIYCLISSIIMFIGGAMLCKYVVLPIWLMVCLAIICNICLLIYAPADTYKRPLINKKKRDKWILAYCRQMRRVMRVPGLSPLLTAPSRPRYSCLWALWAR